MRNFSPMQIGISMGRRSKFTPVESSENPDLEANKSPLRWTKVFHDENGSIWQRVCRSGGYEFWLGGYHQRSNPYGMAPTHKGADERAAVEDLVFLRWAVMIPEVF